MSTIQAHAPKIEISLMESMISPLGANVVRKITVVESDIDAAYKVD